MYMCRSSHEVSTLGDPSDFLQQEAKAPHSFPAKRLAKTTIRSHRLSGHLSQPAMRLVVEIHVHVHEVTFK